jgi:hypothetical protein
LSDFLESAKNLVSSTVNRTSWETQKQLRIHSKQREIEKLVEQRQQIVDELGQVAMTLYQQGALTETQLSRLCASIFELDQGLRSREQQLQEIKGESYLADQFTPASPVDYAAPLSSEGEPASEKRAPFSSSSGPTATPRSTADAYRQPVQGATPPSRGQVRCPQCGSFVRENSLYCRSCGTKVRS